MMSADEHCAIPIDRRNQQQAAALRNIAVPFERQLYISTTELQPIFCFALCHHTLLVEMWSHAKGTSNADNAYKANNSH